MVIQNHLYEKKASLSILEVLHWIAVARHSVPDTHGIYEGSIFLNKWKITLPNFSLLARDQISKSFLSAIDALNLSIAKNSLTATFLPEPYMSADMIENAEEALKNLSINHKLWSNNDMDVVLSTDCPIGGIRFNTADIFSIWPRLDYEYEFQIMIDNEQRESWKKDFGLTDRDIEKFDHFLIGQKNFQLKINYTNKVKSDHQKKLIRAINKLVKLLKEPIFHQIDGISSAIWKILINQLSPRYMYSIIEPLIASNSMFDTKKIDQAKPTEIEAQKHIFIYENLIKSPQIFNTILLEILNDIEKNLTDHLNAYPKDKPGRKEDIQRAKLIENLIFHCHSSLPIKPSAGDNSHFMPICEATLFFMGISTTGMKEVVQSKNKEIKSFLAKLSDEGAKEKSHMDARSDYE